MGSTGECLNEDECPQTWVRRVAGGAGYVVHGLCFQLRDGTRYGIFLEDDRAEMDLKDDKALIRRDAEWRDLEEGEIIIEASGHASVRGYLVAVVRLRTNKQRTVEFKGRKRSWGDELRPFRFIAPADTEVCDLVFEGGTCIGIKVMSCQGRTSEVFSNDLPQQETSLESALPTSHTEVSRPLKVAHTMPRESGGARSAGTSHSEADGDTLTCGQPFTMYLIRHGDRFDYENWEQWNTMCHDLHLEQSDSPLSALGHKQARAIAAAMQDFGIEIILTSPYLRTIQTAQPLAHVYDLRIKVEEGLAEWGHQSGSIPTTSSRCAYFPELDVRYDSLYSTWPAGKERGLEFMRRMRLMAKLLPQRFPNSTVACFSHAGSLALVAAMARCSLRDVGKFAPCGVFKLVGRPGGTFRIETFGRDTLGPLGPGDVQVGSPSTPPWGFKPDMEELWEKSEQSDPSLPTA